MRSSRDADEVGASPAFCLGLRPRYVVEGTANTDKEDRDQDTGDQDAGDQDAGDLGTGVDEDALDDDQLDTDRVTSTEPPQA